MFLQSREAFLCSLLALVLKARNVKSGNRWYYLPFAFMLLAKGAGECSSGAIVGLAKPEQGGVLAHCVQQAAWWWGWQQYTKLRKIKLSATGASRKRVKKVDQ